MNNQGIFNKAKTATRAFKNASENEQTGLDEADKEIAKYMPKEGLEGGSVATGKGTTLPSSSFPIISVPGLKYADLDGDGTADGISSGRFSYTKKETSELREYSENTSYKYTNADGNTVDGTLITCTNNTGTPRYYVLSLANYDGNEHYWYKNAYDKMSDYPFTSKDFEKGKENTEKMIERMKNHSDTGQYKYDYGAPTTGTNADIWNIIEDKVKEGWFVPSKEEWAVFASYLNTSRTSTDIKYYVNYGLSDWYWSSSQGDDGFAWYVNFTTGYVRSGAVDTTNRLRLCATF